MPFTAVLLCALLVLVRGGEPVRASILCGVLLGLAAYLRAVALPLALVIAPCWWLPRCSPAAAARRTALTVAACLLLLLPWAVRNRLREGHLTFSDHHGGATALLGSYPNTDGAYAPAALDLVTHLTGAPFYAEPHGPRDAAAYALARTLRARDPLWSVALLGAHAERLLAPDEGVLCWSATCADVLTGAARLRLERYRAPLVVAANTFYFLVGAAALVGLWLALRERREMALLLGAPAVALAALYVAYFGTPRYHLTILALALPLAALTIVHLGDVRLKGPALARAVAAAVAVVLLFRIATAAAGGVRARHRWAVLACRVDGAPRVCAVRRDDGAAGSSPITGAAGRVDLRGRAVRLEVLGAPLDPGPYQIHLTATPGGWSLPVAHPGGRFSQPLAPPAPGDAPLSITAIELERR
jgi:hypothetical protein